MRTTLGLLVVAVVVGLWPVAAPVAAAEHKYEFTGLVKSVEATLFTVEKNEKETWTFSLDANTKGVPRVGDKVLVRYFMVAKQIEVKKTAEELQKGGSKKKTK